MSIYGPKPIVEDSRGPIYQYSAWSDISSALVCMLFFSGAHTLDYGQTVLVGFPFVEITVGLSLVA